MKLLYPEFLLALAALIIPILIHLFNFRKYKLVKFSQVRFLKEIQQQTQSTSKLKHLLVLISRCLFITALVIAFCQPYLSINQTNQIAGKKGISIYIDNSFSMQANSEEGQLLDVAKNKAISILDAYQVTDQFQIISNNFSANEQRWLSKESAIEAIQNIDYNSNPRSLSEVISRTNSLFEEEDDLTPVRYIISDNQKSFFDWEAIQDSITINLIGFEHLSTSSNVSLDSLAFSKPYRSITSTEEIKMVLKNYGETDIEQIPLQLKLNNTLKAPALVDLKGNDSSHQTISYRNSNAKWQNGVVSIQDFPINYDDSLFFSYPLIQSIQVLHLYETTPSNSIRRLFITDSLIQYSASSIFQADLGSLAQNQLILLDGVAILSSGLQNALKEFIKAGNTICIFPSLDAQTELNSFLNLLNIEGYGTKQKTNARINEINLQSVLFQNVFEERPSQLDLPQVNEFLAFKSNQLSNHEFILRLNNAKDVLRKFEYQEGSVYLFAFPLNDSVSNFSKHAIFVPTLFNMALQAVKSESPLNFMDQKYITINSTSKTESPFKFVKNKFETIPKQRKNGTKVTLEIDESILQAGHYKVMQDNNLITYVALNYSRSESKMDRYTHEEIENLVQQLPIQFQWYNASNESLTKAINEELIGTYLWKYFIALALLFLAIEIALLRLIK